MTNLTTATAALDAAARAYFHTPSAATAEALRTAAATADKVARDVWKRADRMGAVHPQAVGLVHRAAVEDQNAAAYFAARA